MARLVFVFFFIAATHAAQCPCLNATECLPVTVSREREIFGFYGGNETSWATELDWSRITTIAWPPVNPEFLCTAHRHGVRVILGTPPHMPLTANTTERSLWVQEAVAQVLGRFADGLTFDYESPMDPTDPSVQYYNDVVSETTMAMHTVIPTSQVSVCVAWSPDDIDGRGYDYVGLSNASDLLYIMSYDTRSQITDRCTASANAAYPVTVQGVMRYLSLGIPPLRLILGVPWYGYKYTCLTGVLSDGVCWIPQVPFRGVNCSDAAGSEMPFSDVMKLVDGDPRNVSWEPYLQASYYTNQDTTGATQIWFDDVRSLTAKYLFARSVGLRGVGPYTFSDLDLTGTRTGNPKAPAESLAMWEALDAFLLPRTQTPSIYRLG